MGEYSGIIISYILIKAFENIQYKSLLTFSSESMQYLRFEERWVLESWIMQNLQFLNYVKNFETKCFVPRVQIKRV